MRPFVTPLLAAFFLLLFSGLSHAEKQQPNIILILVDDMGWGDLGCFHQNERAQSGKPALTTPNLDRMAQEGVQLRRHYSGAPVCAPSRASLFSGVHQGHARTLRDNTFDIPLENSHTLATVLKQAGYATAIIGKWGIGGGKESEGDPDTSTAYPTKRGFNYFFGWLDHIAGHRHYPKEDKPANGTTRIWDQNRIITDECDNAYSTDLLTARAKKWITDETRKTPEKPFFLALTYIAPHAALEVANQPYPQGGGLHGGLQWIGKPGQLINTARGGKRDAYIEPRYAAKNWPESAKRHASMIARIDDGVGDIIHLLKDLKIDEKTFIVFLSDNGPHNEGSFMKFVQNSAFFASYGIFGGIKRDTWEGGLRVPAIVRWPQHVPDGRQTDSPGQFHDWMATFADLAGIPVPDRCDGVSLLPSITGQGVQQPGIIYTEYNYPGTTPDYQDFAPSHRKSPRNQMQVLMIDSWKGIRLNISSQDDDFMIFDTEKDPSESNNLAGTSPEMEKIQQRMKDRVLQIRRPCDYFNKDRGNMAKRPYDNALVPASAIDLDVLEPGLAFIPRPESDLPWVPKITKDAASLRRAVNGINMTPFAKGREHRSAGHWTGYINIPEDGNYKFFITTDDNKGSKAFARLHDMQLIDADFAYKPGTRVDSSSAIGAGEERPETEKTPVRLKKGLHPVSIGYVHGKGEEEPKLIFEWESPRIPRQTVPNSAFFRDRSSFSR